MSEASEIKRDGAKAVKNSGRSRGLAKGDAILEPFLVDYKEYTESFGVSRKVWAKLSSDAIYNGRRLPALKLVLGAQDETPVRLWVVGDEVFHEMLEAWKEKHE